MRFNEHSGYTGAHAFLSPSNYHWINYSEDKLLHSLNTAQAARRGTEMHELAQRLIRLKIGLPETSETVCQYVNDAIYYRMTAEQLLFYSNNCFGTADAISFSANKLRIHDLKTGTIVRASEKQLLVYAAIFCLEYGEKPHMFESELRIYQNDEVRKYIADPDDIVHIMDKIVTFDNRINAYKNDQSE
jgi:hypothetical protein